VAVNKRKPLARHQLGQCSLEVVGSKRDVPLQQAIASGRPNRATKPLSTCKRSWLAKSDA
jgi:hypothetical protein